MNFLRAVYVHVCMRACQGQCYYTGAVTELRILFISHKRYTSPVCMKAAHSQDTQKALVCGFVLLFGCGESFVRTWVCVFFFILGM